MTNGAWLVIAVAVVGLLVQAAGLILITRRIQRRLRQGESK